MWRGRPRTRAAYGMHPRWLRGHVSSATLMLSRLVEIHAFSMATARGRGRPRHIQSFKFPEGGFGLEEFLPHREDDFGADCEYWFFHGQDVVFHRGHVEVVFRLVPGHEFAAGCDVSDFRDALDNHGFVCVFGADDAVVIARQVAGLPRLASGTEQ